MKKDLLVDGTMMKLENQICHGSDEESFVSTFYL